MYIAVDTRFWSPDHSPDADAREIHRLIGGHEPIGADFPSPKHHLFHQFEADLSIHVA